MKQRAGFWTMVAALVAGLVGLGPTAKAAQQQPQRIELDAATMAARTDAARAVIPLLGDIKERADAGVQAQVGGGAPPSPFTGQPTTVFSVTLSKRKPVDPQVVSAMERLLKWEPGNRSAEYESALFDRWFEQLSVRASAIATRQGLVSCDASCVTRTLTALDESWGKTERARAEARDEVLLETLTEAVKGKD